MATLSREETSPPFHPKGIAESLVEPVRHRVGKYSNSILAEPEYVRSRDLYDWRVVASVPNCIRSVFVYRSHRRVRSLRSSGEVFGGQTNATILHQFGLDSQRLEIPGFKNS